MEEKTFPDSYVVVDLETTGLSPREDSILEIGAVMKVKKRAGGPVPTRFFVDPQRPVTGADPAADRDHR